jgi:hypothetical protein
VFDREIHRRVLIIVAPAGVVLSGCNMSEPSVVGTLPRVEPDLTDLQRTELPDECLTGRWTVETGDLDMFLVGLLQMNALHVTDGTVYVDFTWDGNYVYASDGFVLRIDLGPNDTCRERRSSGRPGSTPRRGASSTCTTAAR